jgi:hypothetical protein
MVWEKAGFSFCAWSSLPKLSTVTSAKRIFRKVFIGTLFIMTKIFYRKQEDINPKLNNFYLGLKNCKNI